MFTKLKKDVDIHETFFAFRKSAIHAHAWLDYQNIFNLWTQYSLFIVWCLYSTLMSMRPFFENQPDLPANAKLLTTFTKQFNVFDNLRH